VASAVEQHLYGSRGTHALRSITLAERRVVFEDAELRHVWADPDTKPEEAALPWDIIGFDSTELAGGRWEFVVNCSVVEFCWRSAWPGRTRRCT
jgi:hypothetical protein